MNPDWVATHSGSSSFHFSFRIEHSIRNEMSIQNHVTETSFNPEWDFHSPWSFNPPLNLPCKHELKFKYRSGLKLNPDSCKLPLTKLYINFKNSSNFPEEWMRLNLEWKWYTCQNSSREQLKKSSSSFGRNQTFAFGMPVQCFDH